MLFSPLLPVTQSLRDVSAEVLRDDSLAARDIYFTC